MEEDIFVSIEVASNVLDEIIALVPVNFVVLVALGIAIDR